MIFRPAQSKPVPAGRVTTPASWRLPVNREQVEMFVNIVTDDVFSNEKARKELNWEPLDVVENYKI